MAPSIFIGWFGGQQLSSDGSTTTFAGNLSVTGQFYGPAADNTAAPPFSFLGDTNTGVGSAAADTLNLVTGGTSRVSVSTTAVTSTLPVTLTSATAPNVKAQGGTTFRLGTADNNGMVIVTNDQDRWQVSNTGDITDQGTSDLRVNGGLACGVAPGANGNVNALTYSVNGVAGASGTGTVISSITVVNGLVTAITVA